MNTADDFVAGKLLTGEVFFKQAFVGFSDRFGNSGGQAVQTMTEVRHIHLMCFTLVVVGVSFHVDEVDVAFYLLVFYIRNHDRADRWTEGGFKLFKYFIEIRMFHVQLGNEEEGRLGQIFCHLVGFFGADIDAGFTGNGNQQAFGCAHTLCCLSCEVEQSGSVNQIDLGAAPGKGGNSGANRYFALDFFWVKVTDGIALRSFSQSIAGACFKKQSFCQ